MTRLEHEDENPISNQLVTSYTGLLTPREHSKGTFITPDLDRFYRIHERMMTRFSSIEFNKIGRELVTPDDISAVRWAMLLESHYPVYASQFLTSFSPNHEISAFLVLQTYEELMHHTTLRSYLVEGEFVEANDLDAEMIEVRAGPWGERERGYTPLQNYTDGTLQEAGTTRYYRGWSKRTREPVLKGLFGSISKDETRHGQWYLGQAKIALAGNPRGLDEVDQVFLEFDMPGSTFITRHPEYRAAMRGSGVVGMEDVIAVIGKAAELVGLPHMLKLVGSSAFRDKVTGEYNIDTKQVLRHFLLRRGV